VSCRVMSTVRDFGVKSKLKWSGNFTEDGQGILSWKKSDNPATLAQLGCLNVIEFGVRFLIIILQGFLNYFVKIYGEVVWYI